MMRAAQELAEHGHREVDALAGTHLTGTERDGQWQVPPPVISV